MLPEVRIFTRTPPFAFQRLRGHQMFLFLLLTTPLNWNNAPPKNRAENRNGLAIRPLDKDYF